MPRTILTDAVIEKKCPEYQPLGFPNAYFDNVGGFYKSEGIKPTPVRPPPRPARIQYLSSNAKIPLDKVRDDVDTNRELAQPRVQRITASAPPFEATDIPPPTYNEGVFIGIPPPTYEEGAFIGIPPPTYDLRVEGEFYKTEELEEKTEIPKVEAVEPAITPEGDPSFITEAQETIRQIEELLGSVDVETPTKHIVDHTTPIDEGVDVKRVQAERMSMLGEESLSRMRETQDAERRIQALEETVRLAEQLPAEAQTKAIQQIERIATASQQRQEQQRELDRNLERLSKQMLEEKSAVENVGVSGLQQPSREEAQERLEKIGKKALRKQEKRKTRQEGKREREQGRLSRFAERHGSFIQSMGEEEYLTKYKPAKRLEQEKIAYYKKPVVEREEQKLAQKALSKMGYEAVYRMGAKEQRFKTNIAGKTPREELFQLRKVGREEEVAEMKRKAIDVVVGRGLELEAKTKRKQSARKGAITRSKSREARIKTFGAEEEGRAYYKQFGAGEDMPRKGDPRVSAKMEKEMAKTERVMMMAEDIKEAGIKKSLRGSFAQEL